MSAAANYNRPKPIDPLWYRPTCTLRIWCKCGRTLSEQVQTFQKRHGLPAHMTFRELMERLRCTHCGKRPEMEVTR